MNKNKHMHKTRTNTWLVLEYRIRECSDAGNSMAAKHSHIINSHQARLNTVPIFSASSSVNSPMLKQMCFILAIESVSLRHLLKHVDRGD